MRRIKTILRELWQEVAPHYDAKSWFLGLGTLCLIVIWLYFGSPQFFMRSFGEALADDPMRDWWQYLYYHVAAFLLIGVLPLAMMRFGFGVAPTALGIQVGDWRFGIKAVLLCIVVATPFVLGSAYDPAFQAEYPLTKLAGASVSTWIMWELTYLIYYLGWEACFRGSMLFGLKEKIGVGGALLFQTAISTLVHLDAGLPKPFGETFGAAPAGLLFGALALRTKSILWPLLLHWYLGALMDMTAYGLSH